MFMFYMFQKYARAKLLNLTLRKSENMVESSKSSYETFYKLKKTLQKVNSSPYLWIMKHNMLSIMLGQTRQPFLVD